MAKIELPLLRVDQVTATTESKGPLLINRNPGPGETEVPLTSTIELELVDPGINGIDRNATAIWVNRGLAFRKDIQPAFRGPRSSVRETADTLAIVLDPVVPFESQSTVDVRIVSRLKKTLVPWEQTYSFEVEDRTAPKLVAAIALGQKLVRAAFDEDVVVVDPAGIRFEALDFPAVPILVEEATIAGSLVDLQVSPEMTPDVRYQLTVTGVADLKGNPVQPPFNTIVFQGFRPARPTRRRFDLWTMLPKHNRRADATGDLARFIGCLQEVTDLLLAEVDRFPDIFDIERAPIPFLDLILQDLGNPFPFDLEPLAKRRLASVLVEMYSAKGTAPGIRNAIRFFLGIEIDAITGLAETALVLGESELGVDWELGPSDRLARYAFDVRVARLLTALERKQMRMIVNYLKPAHTHFVNLLEPIPPVTFDHWVLGESEMDIESLLH